MALAWFPCVVGTPDRVTEKSGAIKERNKVVTTSYSSTSELNIHFNLRETKLAEDQQKLITEIQKALTVVDVVFQEKKRRRASESAMALRRWIFWRTHDDQLTSQDDVSRRNYYIDKLAEVARDGLAASDKVRYWFETLEGVKNEFVAREANFVKNFYVRVLGRRAAAYCIPFGAVYWLLHYFDLGYIPSHYKQWLGQNQAAIAP